MERTFCTPHCWVSLHQDNWSAVGKEHFPDSQNCVWCCVCFRIKVCLIGQAPVNPAIWGTEAWKLAGGQVLGPARATWHLLIPFPSSCECDICVWARVRVPFTWDLESELWSIEFSPAQDLVSLSNSLTKRTWLVGHLPHIVKLQPHTCRKKNVPFAHFSQPCVTTVLWEVVLFPPWVESTLLRRKQ